MRCILSIALAWLVVVPTPALASGGWTEDLTITSAFTEDSDLIVVHTNTDHALSPGCAAGLWIFVAATEERRARAWSTILTALVSGKKIRFWRTGACSAWQYHAASAVSIIP